MPSSREIRLKTYAVGMPTRDNFEFAEVEVGPPGPGEVQVRNTWMSVDPYMRGRISGRAGYAAGFEIGKALGGGAMGEVVASNDPAFAVGDLVRSWLGWRELYNVPASHLVKIDLRGLTPQAFLGVAGMPGLTAYAGLLRTAGLKDGDVVFVSGGAGAVGSLVAQIAKAKGHRVIATAGGPDKVAYLREIGVDHAVDYKAEANLTAAVQAGAPDGIDVYFDNVGGAHLEAALNVANERARFAMCGMISTYNATEAPAGPRNISLMVGKRIRMEGLIVLDHMDLEPRFLDDLSDWVAEGKVSWKETVFDGLDRAPDAFAGLFTGENLGKMLVKL